MTNLTINTNKGTIEMTKAFEKAASRFGSPEYKDLQQAKKDYPSFRVVVKKVKSGDHMKGLNFSYMETYIKNHPEDIEFEYEDGSSDTVSALEAFYVLCGKDAEGNVDGNLTKATYGQIKKWFLEIYPEVEKMSNCSSAILSGKKVVKKNTVTKVA